MINFGSQRVKLVKSLAAPIIKESGLSKLDWEFIVVDQDMANAFVLPGTLLSSPLLSSFIPFPFTASDLYYSFIYLFVFFEQEGKFVCSQES